MLIFLDNESLINYVVFDLFPSKWLPFQIHMSSKQCSEMFNLANKHFGIDCENKKTFYKSINPWRGNALLQTILKTKNSFELYKIIADVGGDNNQVFGCNKKACRCFCKK